MRSYSVDGRPREWLEHLTQRLHSENYCRTHFPVVLESSNSQWWSHEVYHRMNVESHHMPAVDTYQPNAA